MKKLIFIFCLPLFIINSCKSDPKEDTIVLSPKDEMPKLSSNRDSLNISILLDLSDRIDTKTHPNPSMDYYLRDVGYIESIAQAFEMHVRSKRSITINDKIKLFIDPEPTNKELNKRLELLRTNFDKNNAKRDLIINTSVKYDSISRLIYSDAISDANYVGSDTWGFIKTKAQDYCIEANKRNILVILTDGFIYHKDNIRVEGNKTSYLTAKLIEKYSLNAQNWKDKMESKEYGFIVPNVDLKNLEILVLGINAEQIKPYGNDIVVKYWEDWLTALKVKKYDIKLTGLPVNIDNLIKEFILNEKI